MDTRRLRPVKQEDRLSEENSGTLGVRLPLKVIELLEKQAAAEGTSRNKLILALIEEGLKRGKRQ